MDGQVDFDHLLDHGQVIKFGDSTSLHQIYSHAGNPVNTARLTKLQPQSVSTRNPSPKLKPSGNKGFSQDFLKFGICFSSISSDLKGILHVDVEGQNKTKTM